MDKQQAQNIVKDTFENPFDKGRFIRFVRNLLNKIEEDSFTYQGNYIPDAYKQHITTLERIGKYIDGEHKIDILVAKLKKETSIERARTMQRNFIAWYLNGSRGGEMKDAALVAFVSPDEDDWRFSLVKMDYRFVEDEKGGTKVKEEFTPARRWSFLVGKNENSHTAKSQLVPIIEDDEHNPTLAQLEDAFNIEKVTKEFFEKYRELFLWTKETLDNIVMKEKKIKSDFENKGVNTVDFAKKLLGQIVFLYFLQKKGWFGVKRDADWGTGPKNFLRELFERKHGNYQNFFNDIMEPLFYQALRNDRRHDDDYYDKLNCKIPFLNGGLFDPINNYDWVHTDILLPNELFSNSNKTKEGDTGNGILDIFDRYNFTVKEDEPLEKEVAIDPEMLGKAFEKLGAITPEKFDEWAKAVRSGNRAKELEANKKLGIYYTPREIVHYMCQQSLINYLYTELNQGPVAYEKLGDQQFDAFGNKVKKGQLDLTIEHKSTPGISKEALEILIKYGEHISENEATVEAKGRETDTYSYKLPESIRQNAKLIDDKLANIKVCDPAIGSGAFPVGMMSEIVKARNVFSIYIKNPDRTVYNFKRECIEKSLYGVDIDPGAVEIAKLRLWLSLVVDEEDIKQIKPLPNLDYKIVCGNSLLGVEKDLLNSHLFKELERLKLLLFNETNPGKKQEYKKQIDELISQITKGHKEFDFTVYFSEVFHQKGGFDVVIANPPYISHVNFSKKDKELIAQSYQTFKGRADLYAAFYEKGIDLLKETGVLTYISSNKFFRSGYGGLLRKFLRLNAKMLAIIDFGDTPLFEATTYPCIVILQKEIKMCYFFYYLEAHSISDVTQNKNYQSFENDYLLNDIWSFSGHEFLPIWNKMKENAVSLGDYISDQFYRGIVTGLNEAFTITEKEKVLLLSKNPLIRDIIKPYLKGRDVKRWHAEGNTYILFTYHGIDIKRYPEVLDYLKPYRKKLEQRATSQSHKWYELQQPQTGIFSYYELPKIICTDIAKRCEFTIDYTKSFIDATLFCIPIDDLYLLALLNSTPIEVYYRSISSVIRGNFLRFKKIYLYRLPIIKASDKDKKQIIYYVKEIIRIMKHHIDCDGPAKIKKIRNIERQIDQMVYKLYGLTEEEIKIVEESVKKN